MRPGARDDGTDDSDGEHPDIHHVGEVVLRPDDADGKVHPDEEERCRERNADGGSVRDIACLPRYQHIRETSAEDEGTGENEIGQVPDHFIGNLHRQQGYQQYERCHECNANDGSVRVLDQHGDPLLERGVEQLRQGASPQRCQTQAAAIFQLLVAQVLKTAGHFVAVLVSKLTRVCPQERPVGPLRGSYSAFVPPRARSPRRGHHAPSELGFGVEKAPFRRAARTRPSSLSTSAASTSPPKPVRR